MLQRGPYFAAIEVDAAKEQTQDLIELQTSRDTYMETKADLLC